MTGFPEGSAIVYCEGGFNTPYGKTAHGLVRKTLRYRVLSVVDSHHAGADAREVLDGRPSGVPVVADLEAAISAAKEAGAPATHFVVGLAPDGGRLSGHARDAVREAIASGLNVDSGLHDFISEDAELVEAAAVTGVCLRDVRKPPPRDQMHFFSGVIDEVKALKIALLGTDSAVGKRTTATLLVDGLRAAGHGAELIGTGQTAWLQGVEFGIMLDSLVNDFIAGELEHVVHRAWQQKRPAAIVVEGQGSLMNPAYPGGFEILAATRPDIVVLQHAPARKEYDGFPGFAMDPLETQIRAIELISKRPVVAITVNHEGIPAGAVHDACRRISEETGLPAVDVLLDGPDALVKVVAAQIASASTGQTDAENP